MSSSALTRRGCLALPLALLARPAAASPPVLRLGVLQFGTVQWVAELIRRHRLDAAAGFTLQMLPLASNDAGRVALMARSADVVVSDWPFAAAQRARGIELCFAPFSSATGGVLARADSKLRGLADLAGKRLGVAGGPLDKSWLLVQAAARASGTDLAQAATPVFGAPPLLSAKLMQGELDAVLTFWNFAARLEAQGCRMVTTVADCAASLGLPRRLGLVGFTFHQDWAEQHRAALDGFLAAVAAAEGLLARPGAASDAAWAEVRPLMQAKDDALFTRLRAGFVSGIAHPSAAEQAATAQAVLAVLLRTGGKQAADGLAALPPGLFWQARDVPL